MATHLRYTTLLELPDGEQVIAENVGDKGFWDIQDNTRNLVFVKPLGDKAGRDTDLYISTASGNVYGFTLKEVSADQKTKSDIRIIIQQGDQDSLVALKEKPKFIPADQVAQKEAQIADLQKQLTKQEKEKPKPTVVHDYVWARTKVAEQFGLKDIRHNDAFTEIEISSQEAPSLYEYVDGKDHLIQYTVDHGVYTIPKVIDAGYLRLGKARLEFHREKG